MRTRLASLKCQVKRLNSGKIKKDRSNDEVELGLLGMRQDFGQVQGTGVGVLGSVRSS